MEPSAKPPRLKIILLGSAGAGKTSLLRRFVNGTFHDGTIASDASSRRRRRRNTMSTLGADYYVKRMENPLFDRTEVGLTSSGCCRCGMPRDLQNSKHHVPCIKSSSSQHKDQTFNQKHVLVQLWDTRGSEPSLLPYNNFTRLHSFNMFQFLSLDDKKRDKLLTDRNGHHLHRYNNWGMDARLESKWRRRGCIDLDVPKRHISQMMKCNSTSSPRNNTNSTSPQHENSPSSNALFNNIDACMLVYDATSSTSFLRLMSCHEEWVRRFRCQEREQSKMSGFPRKRRQRRVPFIVVANKIDLLDDYDNFSASNLPRHRRKVMGFDTYRGIDETYEYAAENASAITTIDQCNQHLKCDNPQHTPSKTKSKQLATNKLTYSLKETAWSSDHHYLHSLQQADDQLSANRTMVLLWCERNGIQHVEASALDGRGVDSAMEELVRLGVEEKIIGEELDDELDESEEVLDDQFKEIQWDDESDHGQLETGFVKTSRELSGGETLYSNTHSVTNDHRNFHEKSGITAIHSNPVEVDKSQYTFLYEPKYEKKLDLFARYSAKEDKRCVLNCLK